MGKRDFARFEFEMCLGRMSYIAIAGFVYGCVFIDSQCMGGYHNTIVIQNNK